MRLYLAGPMGAHFDNGYNFDTFHRAAEHLRTAGHDVVNPAELEGQDADLPPGFTWGDRPTAQHRAWFLKRDFRLLSTCEGIVLLPDWDRSTGASCELLAAACMGLNVYLYGEDDGFLHLRLVRQLSPAYLTVDVPLIEQHIESLYGTSIELGLGWVC